MRTGLDILIDPHFDIERINWIAEQSAYMVNSEITNATMLDLEEFLTAMGVVKRGRDKFSKLADDIECKFGKDLLMELNYPSHHMGRPAPWLYRVLKKKSKLAITHLLIIGTYCDSIKIFQEMSTIGGDKCVLEKNDNSSGVPKVRVLSAKSIFDDRNFDSTLEIAKLLSTMSNMSFRKAAKRLNMGFYEAARILINTNTRFPLDSKFADGLGIENINSIKSDLRRGIYKKEIQKKYKIHDESILKIILDEPIIQSDYFAAMKKRLIERHRKTLSDVISFFPQATRTEIHKKCTQSYLYLKEHDSDWFNNIMPPRSIADNNKSHMNGLKKSRISRVNWNHEDQIFTDKAREVLRQNRELGGKPIWLSKMACLKLIGCQRRYKVSRFPKLSIYLQSNIETRDSFRKRRIKWALIEIKNDRNTLGMLKLQLKSCLSQLVLRDYMEYTIAEAQQLRLSFSYSSAFAQYLLGKGTGNTRMSSNN